VKSQLFFNYHDFQPNPWAPYHLNILSPLRLRDDSTKSFENIFSYHLHLFLHQYSFSFLDMGNNSVTPAVLDSLQYKYDYNRNGQICFTEDSAPADSTRINQQINTTSTRINQNSTRINQNSIRFNQNQSDSTRIR